MLPVFFQNSLLSPDRPPVIPILSTAYQQCGSHRVASCQMLVQFDNFRKFQKSY